MKKLTLIVFLSISSALELHAGKALLGDSYNDVSSLVQTGSCAGTCDLMNLQSYELGVGFKFTSASNLSGANLEYANLSGMDLSNVNFTGADFTGANLSKCTLNNTNFTGANLSGADLSGVTANTTHFNNASLYSADLSNSNFTSSDFTGAGFAGANIDNSNFTQATLINLQVTMEQDLTFKNSKGVSVTIQNQSFLDLRGQTLTNVNFSYANMTGINLSNCILNNVNFTRTNMNGNSDPNNINADLSNVNSPQLAGISSINFPAVAITMNGTMLKYANLTGMDFSKYVTTSIYDVDFTGANLTNTNWFNTATTSSIISQQLITVGMSDSFPSANFTGANLQGANFTGIDVTGVNFAGANLTNATFLNNLKSSDFTGANATNASLIFGNADSCTFDKANLTDAFFIVINFTNSSFQNVTLDNSDGFIVNSSTINSTGTNIPASSAFKLIPFTSHGVTWTPGVQTTTDFINNLFTKKATISAPYPLAVLLGTSGNFYFQWSEGGFMGGQGSNVGYVYTFATWMTSGYASNNATFVTDLLAASNIATPVSSTIFTLKNNVSGVGVAQSTSATNPTCFNPTSLLAAIQKYGVIVALSSFNQKKQTPIACSC